MTLVILVYISVLCASLLCCIFLNTLTFSNQDFNIFPLSSTALVAGNALY